MKENTPPPSPSEALKKAMDEDSGVITPLSEQEIANARAALTWLHALAQLEANKTIKVYHDVLNTREAGAYIRGERDLDQIRKSRRESADDLAPFSSPSHTENQDLSTIKHLPWIDDRDDLKSNVEKEMHYLTWQAEREQLYMEVSFIMETSDIDREFARRWKEEKTMSKEEIQEKRLKELLVHQEEAQNFGLKDLPPAKKVIWVTEARNAYEQGLLHIRTEDGRILPAWEDKTLSGKDGSVISGGLTDNKPLSVDGKFYNSEGGPFYADGFDRLAESVKHGRTILDTPFTKGTPRLEDIEPGTLEDAISEFLDELSVCTPNIANTLAEQAQKLLKGIKAPNKENQNPGIDLD